MTTWRAFIGLVIDDEVDFSFVDQSGLTWKQARGVLATELEPFRADECTDCREAGTDALDRLAALSPDSELRTEVDGHDYWIVRDSAPTCA